MNVYYRNGLITGAFAGYTLASLNSYSYWGAALGLLFVSVMILSDWRRGLIGKVLQGEPE